MRFVFSDAPAVEEGGPDVVVVDTARIAAALTHPDTALGLQAFALLCWCVGRVGAELRAGIKE